MSCFVPLCQSTRGYIWVRYANGEDSGNDGADMAWINDLHLVDSSGLATIEVVGQKVITDGVANTQVLGEAGALSLDGIAVKNTATYTAAHEEGSLIAIVTPKNGAMGIDNGIDLYIRGKDTSGASLNDSFYIGSGSIDEADTPVSGMSLVEQFDDVDVSSIERITYEEYTSYDQLADRSISFAVGDLYSLADYVSVDDTQVPLQTMSLRDFTFNEGPSLNPNDIMYVNIGYIEGSLYFNEGTAENPNWVDFRDHANTIGNSYVSVEDIEAGKLAFDDGYVYVNYEAYNADSQSISNVWHSYGLVHTWTISNIESELNTTIDVTNDMIYIDYFNRDNDAWYNTGEKWINLYEYLDETGGYISASDIAAGNVQYTGDYLYYGIEISQPDTTLHTVSLADFERYIGVDVQSGDSIYVGEGYYTDEDNGGQAYYIDGDTTKDLYEYLSENEGNILASDIADGKIQYTGTYFGFNYVTVYRGEGTIGNTEVDYVESTTVHTLSLEEVSGILGQEIPQNANIHFLNISYNWDAWFNQGTEESPQWVDLYDYAYGNENNGYIAAADIASGKVQFSGDNLNLYVEVLINDNWYSGSGSVNHPSGLHTLSLEAFADSYGINADSIGSIYFNNWYGDDGADVYFNEGTTEVPVWVRLYDHFDNVESYTLLAEDISAGKVAYTGNYLDYDTTAYDGNGNYITNGWSDVSVTVGGEGYASGSLADEFIYLDYNRNDDGTISEYDGHLDPVFTTCIVEREALSSNAQDLEIETISLGGLHVTISSEDNLSDRDITITGTNMHGEEITEVLSGPNNGVVATTALFATVTGVSVAQGEGEGVLSVGKSLIYTEATTIFVNPDDVMTGTSVVITGIDASTGEVVTHTYANMQAELSMPIGTFTEIYAIHVENPTEDDISFYAIAGDGFVDVPLSAERNDEGMIVFTDPQRITIKWEDEEDVAEGQVFRITGLDKDGNVITEMAKGIMEDGCFISEHYFAQLSKVEVGLADGSTEIVISVGTVGAPIIPEQDMSRYGGEVHLGEPIATFESASKITFSSSDDLHDRVFTITGVDAHGVTIVENVTGPVNGMAVSSQSFVSVSSISVDDGALGSIKVGYTTLKGGLTDHFVVSGSGTAEDPFVGHSTNTLDDYRNEADVLLYVNFNGAPAGSVNLFYDLSVQGAPNEDTLYVEYSSDLMSLLQGKTYFGDGESETTILIPVAGDDTKETDEQMTVTLVSSSAGTTIVSGESSTEITITNDDDLVTLSSIAQSVAEGNDNAHQNKLVFTISREDSNTDKDVAWHIEGLSSEDGAAPSAAEEADFAHTSGTVTFAQGATTATIEIFLSADRVYEGTETFKLVLDTPALGSGYSLNNAQANGTITEDDVGVSIVAKTDAVADESTTAHVYTITRVGDTTQASDIVWTVTPEDADALYGFTLTTATVHFNAGETSKDITITTANDTETNSDRDFTVTLTNAVGDTSDIIKATESGTIVEDDAVSLTIGADEVRQKEADHDTMAEFKEVTYTLTRASAEASATYDWAIELSSSGDGYASSADFSGELPTGTVTFAKDELSTTIKVKLASDTLEEADEAFTLHVSASGAEVDAQDITAYIVNDEVVYAVKATLGGNALEHDDVINSDTLVEGDTGYKAVTLTFIRAGDSSSAVTMSYEVAGNTALTGNSVSASDFVDSNGDVLAALPSGSVVFDAYQSVVTKTIYIKSDSVKEASEGLTVVLKDNLAEEQAFTTIKIINDDAQVSLSSDAGATLSEGNHAINDTDLYTTITYTVNRSGDLTHASDVEWKVSATSGITMADFVSVTDALTTNGGLPSGTVHFAASYVDEDGILIEDGVQTFTLKVAKDWLYENDENVTVTLSNPSTGTDIGTASVTTTVENDDAYFYFTATTAHVTEGNPVTNYDMTTSSTPVSNADDFVTLTFDVARGGNYSGAGTVSWRLVTTDLTNPVTIDNTNYQGAITSGGDIYVGDTSGTLTFDGVNANQTITIHVRKDNYQENAEQFKLELYSPSIGASISDTAGVATGTIDNDDIGLKLAVDEVVTVTHAEGLPVAGTGTLVDGEIDPVTMTPTYTEYSWKIERTGDMTQAVDLTWRLLDASGYDWWQGRGVSASLPDEWANDGVVSQWSTWVPSATIGESDFKASSLGDQTVHFDADQQYAYIKVYVKGDAIVETSEAFRVQIDRPANVGDITGIGNEILGVDGDTTRYLTGLIVRDEGRFGIDNRELDINSASADLSDGYDVISSSADAKAEGGVDSVVHHYFKIYRDFTSSGDATVEWRVNGGAVGSETDVNGFMEHDTSISASLDNFIVGQDTLVNNSGFPSGVATIPDGKDYIVIDIQTTGDVTAEDAASFSINISNPSAGSSVDNYKSWSYGYIKNDDHPLISLGKITHLEGDATSTYGSQVITEGNTATYTVYRTGDTTYAVQVDWSITFPDLASANFSSTDYSAALADFTGATNGTVTFNAGESSKTFTITTNNDVVSETWAETFAVELSNARWDESVPANVQSAQTPAISVVAGTMESMIIDNEAAASTVSVSAVQKRGVDLAHLAVVDDGMEGTSGVSQIVYTLTRSGSSAGSAQIGWMVNLPNYGDVSSISGDTTANIYDYSGGPRFAAGYVTFADGETSKQVILSLQTDTSVEFNEDFTFTLIDGKTVLNEWTAWKSPWEAVGSDGLGASNSSGMSIADYGWKLPDSENMYRSSEAYQVTTTVNNDDARIAVNNTAPNNYSSIGQSVYEGDVADKVFTVSLTRNGRIDNDVTVSYVVNDENGAPVTSGVWTLSGTPNANGYGSQTYTKDLAIIQGDTTLSADKIYHIILSNVSDSNVTFSQEVSWNGATSVDIPLTILNDDTTWSISSGTLSDVEGNSNRLYTFHITRPSGSNNYAGAATATWEIVSGDGLHVISADDIDGGLGQRTTNIGQGITDATVQFYVKADEVAEFDETFQVRLVSVDHGAVNTDVASNTLTFTQQNDDTTVEISAPTAVREGDSGNDYYLEYTVTRKGRLDKETTVDWKIVGGTAEASDLAENTPALNATTTLTFASSNDMINGYGEETQTFKVYVKGDSVPESNETVTVELSNVSNGTKIASSQATGTIQDDDTIFSISAGTPVFEGDVAGQMFTVTRTKVTPQDQTLQWSVAGSGISPSVRASDDDFSATTGSVTFTPSDGLTKTFFVAYDKDTTAEFDETYTATIALGVGAENDTISTATATGTIKNDDSVVTVAMAESFREGSTDNAQQISFVVTRNHNTSGTASVSYTLSGDAVTAGLIAGDDVTGLVSFADGESSKTITVDIVLNDVYVGNKDFTVTLSNPSNTAVLVGQGDSDTASIIDDDSTVSIGDASVIEGDSGTQTITFVLDRSTGSNAFDATVGYRVLIDGQTATADDFVDGILPIGTITLSTGAETVNLTLPKIKGDATFEGNETFTLELYNPENGLSLGYATAIGTITNDDDVLSIRDAGTTLIKSESDYALTFYIDREGDGNALVGQSTVSWRIKNALTGELYNGNGDFGSTSGTVTFADGVASKTVSVTITPDSISEADEPFVIELYNAGVGSTIKEGNGVRDLVVTNDDQDIITYTIDTSSQNEGDATDADGYTDYVVTVTRQNKAGATSVEWSVTDISDDELSAIDFKEESGTVSFAAGELTKTFTISVHTDNVGDFDKLFSLEFATPITDDTMGAYVEDDYTELTVVNDDPAFAVSLNSDSFVEGSGTSTKLITFTITRSGDATGVASIGWEIQSDGGEGTANISDFGGYWPSGRTVFNDGETTKTIQVAIAPDSTFEDSESFNVVLSDLISDNKPEGARIVVESDSATIVNDDVGVFVGIRGEAEIIEGNDGDMTDVTFMIRAEGVPNKTVTVNFTLEGSGLSPADVYDFSFSNIYSDYDWNYDEETGEGYVVLRTDADGYAEVPVIVTVSGDDIAGANETFRLRITEVEGGTVAEAKAEVTIVNDDTAIASIVNTTVDSKEGNDGDTTIYTFTLTRSGSTLAEAEVSYVIEGFGDNQADGEDFVGGGMLPKGTVTFDAGSATATIEIEVAGDNAFESDEGFIVIVGQDTPNEVRLAAEIVNDDSASLLFNGLVTTIKEGNDSDSPNYLSYEIIRNGDNSEELVVTYTVAEEGQDDIVKTITIPAGESRYILNIPVMANTEANADRTLSVSISAEGFADPAPIESTIVDDDSGVSIELVSSVPSVEGNSEDTIYTFRINRVGNDLVASNIAWMVAGLELGINTAVADDFTTEMSGVVAFAENELSKEFTIVVKADTFVENNEHFRVELTSSSDGQKILVESVDAVIVNDDDVTDAADIIYGGAGVDIIHGLGGNDEIHGGAGADVLFGGDGDDTIYAEGGADVIYAGAGADTIVINSVDFMLLDGGLGFDTLTFEGEGGMTLDFTDLPGEMKSIEAIDISGFGEDTLDNLSYDAVFDINENHALYIKCDADDILDIGAFTAMNTTVTRDAIEYNVYQATQDGLHVDLYIHQVIG